MPVTERDILTYIIPKSGVVRVRKNAEAACIGGRSNVRGSDRQEALSEDQIVGQAGQYAGSLWLYGNIVPYLNSRWVANQNPTKGDGGCDLIGTNIDFKTSRVRSRSRDLLSYRLAVRPRELYDDWTYVLALVTRLEDASPIEVKLIGWASTKMLPSEPEVSGVFFGAFTVRGADLCPLPPLRHLWRE